MGIGKIWSNFFFYSWSQFQCKCVCARPVEFCPVNMVSAISDIDDLLLLLLLFLIKAEKETRMGRSDV